MPVFALLLLASLQVQDSADVLIRGGTLHDGSGRAAQRADVAMRGDRIIFVGDASRSAIKAGRIIDATGLIVAPGFIDPHTHSFEGLAGLDATGRQNRGALMQGVTTVVSGADGRGPLDVARYMADAERAGIGTNTYALAGFGTARGRVMGSSSAKATPAHHWPACD